MTTTDQLLDLDGIGQRQASFKFEALDLTLGHLDWLDVSAEQTVTIANDSSQIIQRTMSGFSLPPDAGEAFEEAQARIRPWMVLENGAEFPLGTFLFVDARRIRDMYGVAFEGTLGDLGVLLNVQSTESYGLGIGANIAAAIAGIFEAQGITNYLIDPTGIEIGTPVAWPAGTSWKQIVDELAALMGCLPSYFEADGRTRVRITPDVALDPVDVTYASGLNIFDTGIADSTTLLSAPNFFKVIESGLTTGDIVGTYSVPDSAPNSVFNLGRVVPDVSNQQGMRDETTANEVARQLSITKGTVVENLSFQGPPDPRHSNFSILSVLGARYLERSWSLICGEGDPMTHDCSKVYS